MALVKKNNFVSLRKSRKGVFFTLIALLIAGLILFGIIMSSAKKYSEKTDAVGIRLETMNDFMQDLEHDMERALYITSFRSLLALEQYIVSRGEYLPNVENSFAEALFNGTVNQTSVELMANATFTLWIERVRQDSEKIDVDFSIELVEVKIFQESPWFLSVNLSTILNVTDSNGIASWSKPYLVSTRINVEGLEDPFYLVESNGLVTNIIVKANNTNFVNELTNDTTVLLNHVNQSLYIQSTRAPDFLMRLTGNYSNSTNGIESIVNVDDFIAQGFAAKDRSSVDFIYFSTVPHVEHSIFGISDEDGFEWFRLDNDSLVIYEAENLILD